MEKLTIDEQEYSCKVANKTMLTIKKDFLDNALKTTTLKDLILHLANKIFDSKDFYNKQKIVALINLLKDIRANTTNESYKYSLNLIIRNLNAYRKVEKETEVTTTFIIASEKLLVIDTLIVVAFSNSFNNILKTIYVK